MRIVSLDAETYWSPDYTLSKMTTEAYVRDPRFELIGMAVSIDQKPPVWLEEAQWRYFAANVDWSQVACTAHHAHFDGLILSHHYGVRPARWLDTLSMSRAYHAGQLSNSLEALLVHHGLRPKGDYVQHAKGKHRHDLTPAEFAEYGAYSCNDVVGHQGLLRIFLPWFTRSELDLQDLTVKMFTQPLLVMNEAVLADCLAYEQQRKLELLHKCGLIDTLTPTPEVLEAAKKHLNSADKFAAALTDLGIEPPRKLNTSGSDYIYAFAKTDPDFQALLEDADEDVRIICEARQAVRSTLNESRTTRMLAMAAGGRPCPVYLKYAAAHTWRWGGGDKVNWQNFERTNKKNPRKGMIRKAVCAPPGHMLVVGDSSQIHVRENAWLAGQEDLLRSFRNGEDVYSAFASEAYRRPIDRKRVAADEVPGQVGKVCELGLGFGMGWYKLSMEFMKGAVGTPPVQFKREDLVNLGVDPSRFLANPKNIERIKAMPSRLPIDQRLVHCAVSNYFVEVYRHKNKFIVQQWDFAEKVLDRIIAKRTGPVFYLGCLSVIEDGLRGPDGTMLRYPGLSWSKEGGYTYWSGRERVHLYGGKVIENVVQFIERAIMGRATLRLNATMGGRGQIVWLSHDEIVACVPEAYAGQCQMDMHAALVDVPRWADGLPLAAEVNMGRVYGEIK